MNNNKITVKGQQFLIVEVIAVNQKNSRFYVGVVPANDFLDLYTVEPVEYNSEKEAAIAATFKDDMEYFDYLNSTRLEKGKSNRIERPEDKARVKEITKFLENEEFPLFPNTIIASCQLINDQVNLSSGASLEEIANLNTGNLPYLQESASYGEKARLYLTCKPHTLLVIDGQHRLRGLQESSDSVRENYDLLVSFILGFPQSVLAKLFYTINYNQKPVTRSIIYHLMGQFEPELNETTFMSEVMRVLNEVDGSPFYRRIKMLGTVDKGASPDVRAKMTISQGFMVDYLVNTVDYKAMRSSVYPPIFLYYFQHNEMRPWIIRFLLNYFRAVQKLKGDDWENPADSVICSSIGIGALIRVMHFLFLKLFIDEFKWEPAKIGSMDTTQLAERLKGIESVDFTKDKWHGLSSGGALTNMVEYIASNISYLKAGEYHSFVELYKANYVAQFKQWITKNVTLPR